MRKKLQVFISSTYIDLIEERQACVQAILKAGHIPAGMELFTAGDKSQLEVIEKWIDDSDICVLLLGARYGSIEPESGLSYTELEYRYAAENNKPIFALVQNEVAKELKVKKLGTKALENENLDKYSKFKTLVTSKMCEFFEDLKDIKYQVSQTINLLEKERNFSGWISGADVETLEAINTKKDAVIEENEKLNREIANLREQLAQKQPSINSESYNGLTYQQVVKVFHQKEFILPDSVFESASGQTRRMLTMINFFASELSIGVSNAMGTSKREVWCFYNIASELVKYGIVEHVNVGGGAQWQRLRTTKLGNQFLVKIQNDFFTKPEPTKTKPTKEASGRDQSQQDYESPETKKTTKRRIKTKIKTPLPV